MINKKKIILGFIAFFVFGLLLIALNVHAIQNLDTITQSNKSSEEKRNMLIAEFMATDSQYERARISEEVQKLNNSIGDVKVYEKSQRAVYAPEIFENTTKALEFMDYLTAGTGLAVQNPRGGDYSSYTKCEDTIKFGQLQIPSFCKIEALPNFYPVVLLIAFCFLLKGGLELMKYTSNSTMYADQLKRMSLSCIVLIVVLSGGLLTTIVGFAGVTNSFTRIGLQTFAKNSATDCNAKLTIQNPAQGQPAPKPETTKNKSPVCEFWRKTGNVCLTNYTMSCAIQESSYSELANSIKKTQIQKIENVVIGFDLPLGQRASFDCSACTYFMQASYFWSAWWQSLPLLFYVFIMIATLPLTISVMLLLDFIKFLFRIYFLPFRAGADLDGGDRVAEDIADIFQYFIKIISLSMIISFYFYLLEFIFVTQEKVFAVIYVFVISTILLGFSGMFNSKVRDMVESTKGNFRSFVGSKTKELSKRSAIKTSNTVHKDFKYRKAEEIKKTRKKEQVKKEKEREEKRNNSQRGGQGGYRNNQNRNNGAYKNETNNIFGDGQKSNPTLQNQRLSRRNRSNNNNNKPVKI